MRTVALVSCVKSKRAQPAPAKELYASPLFHKSRAYAELVADEWFVLSARHGLVHPETVIEPYEKTLKGASATERRRWALAVAKQMREAGLTATDTRVVWLAGQDYMRELSKLLVGLEGLEPMKGMRLGGRLAWLSKQLEQAREEAKR